jgi:hypothetical protein
MTATKTETLSAVFIPSSGDFPQEVNLLETTDGFRELQKLVGGYVQVIALRGQFAGFELWLNEEGKLMNLPFNTVATLIWEECYGRTDVVVGNAVITKGANARGVTPTMNPAQVAKVLGLIKGWTEL